MDLNSILDMGAELIKNNSDKATTHLNTSSVASALKGLLGGAENGASGIESILGDLLSGANLKGNVAELISSWVGSGENIPIRSDQVKDLISEEKVAGFAEKLGISIESAQQAIADSLPEMVNRATPDGDSGMLDILFAKNGAIGNIAGVLGKMFS